MWCRWRKTVFARRSSAARVSHAGGCTRVVATKPSDASLVFGVVAWGWRDVRAMAGPRTGTRRNVTISRCAERLPANAPGAHEPHGATSGSAGSRAVGAGSSQDFVDGVSVHNGLLDNIWSGARTRFNSHRPKQMQSGRGKAEALGRRMGRRDQTRGHTKARFFSRTRNVRTFKKELMLTLDWQGLGK